MSQARLEAVKKAYAKLDVNKDGSVKLDDIAQNFDATQHPDVLSGQRTETDLFMEFMSLWDTQVKDGIVTFEEFSDYYRDVSGTIASDAEFEKCLQDIWKF